jgi:hypothetical protein
LYCGDTDTSVRHDAGHNDMSRPAYVYALAVVGIFAALGAGLAANFTLGFFIEQFVDPGTDPLDSTQVGIMFLVSVFLIYAVGPLAAGVAGVGVGQALPDRDGTAAVVAGVGSFVGFSVFAGLGLFLTFSVLAEYGPGGGGGGGGGGGPIDPSAPGTLMLQVSLPVGLICLASAYLTSRTTRRLGQWAISESIRASIFRRCSPTVVVERSRSSAMSWWVACRGTS